MKPSKMFDDFPELLAELAEGNRELVEEGEHPLSDLLFKIQALEQLHGSLSPDLLKQLLSQLQDALLTVYAIFWDEIDIQPSFACEVSTRTHLCLGDLQVSLKHIWGLEKGDTEVQYYRYMQDFCGNLHKLRLLLEDTPSFSHLTGIKPAGPGVGIDDKLLG